MSEPVRSSDVPHSRLTRICDAMVTTMDEHPETWETDKAIVFLEDGVKGGIVLHGYADDLEAMADLLTHLAAVFQANGLEFQVIPVTEVNQG